MFNKHAHLKQPPVFYLAFVTSMCERFGFYVLSYLLVLFAKNVFNLSDTDAFKLFAVFTSLAYITPVLGGYLADNVMGIRRAIITGLIVEAIGLAFLAFHSTYMFMLGLACVVIGVGFFKTGPTNLLARSYKTKDPRIDSGFTLFYMGINIGSGIAAFSAGIIQHYYGWHIAFATAAVIVFVGLLCYFILRQSAEDIDSTPGKNNLSFKIIFQISTGILITGAIFTMLIQHSTIAYAFFALATLSLLVYFLYEIARSNRQDKLKIIACILLIIMGMMFFILYFQMYTSMNLFVERCIEHRFFGVHIPTSTFLSLNGVWILILSPLLAALYNHLGSKGTDLPVTTKFPMGLLIISLCFFVLAYSVSYANQEGLISPSWVVLSIGLYSLGELLISALGVAMVTHISPKHLYGVMMGAWYLSTALAASLASQLANLSSIPADMHDQLQILHIYQRTFVEIGLIGAVATAIAFIASPYIKKIAQIG
ncbi:MAG: oligopeptide:H+ symporter [Pseudomonadota bacterium]